METVRIKRIILTLTLVVTVIIAASFLSTSFDKAYAQSVDFKSGEGTAQSPYIISTPKELDNVRYHRDSYFLQRANIDMSEYKNFTPIGSITFPFSGHYDGGKYSITNLTVNSTDNNVGMFSYIRGGEVINLKIKDSSIRGGYNVGAFAGINQGSLIGCIADCEVAGIGAVGGICGLNSGIVKECGNLGEVKSGENGAVGEYAGGICGINHKYIQDSYNRGQINYGAVGTTYSGGIAGRSGGSSSALIERTYNVGKVGGKARGEIVGDNMGQSAIKDCFWLTSDLDISAAFGNEENSKSDAKYSISQKEFSQAKTFGCWKEFNDLWLYLGNDSYPILRRQYVPVESVSFEEAQIQLKPGEEYVYAAKVMPIHATRQDITYKISGEESSFEIDKNTRTIRVKDDARIGAKIYLTATAENRETTQTITVTKIPVESIEIINESGIEEINAATSLKFKGIVYPDKASYRGVTYRVSSSYADITQDGVLTVKDDAPIGLVLTVTAVSDDNANIFAQKKVVVTKVKTERVEITNANNFKVTQGLKLTAEIYPSKATDKEIKFQIVSATAKGAQIIGDYLYADGLGEVTVRAYSGGVYSDDTVIRVMKEPVQSIIFDMPTKMTCGDYLTLSAKAVPDNATDRKIQYGIVDGEAEIINGVLYAHRDGVVTVSACADGVTAYHSLTVNKIPVEQVLLTCGDAFKHTQSMRLDAQVLPHNATYKDVTYSIADNTAGAYVKDNILYAAHPGTLTLRAQADGAYDEREISVLKEAVTAVDITADYVENKDGEALQFKAEVYPKNATYKDVEYHIVSGPATITRDGLLIIDSAAEAGSEILIYASADGVDSEIYRIVSGRIEVGSVSLSAEANTVIIGGSVELRVDTDPIYVSNPGISYEIKGNAEIINNVLYVNDVAMIGGIVEITAIVDGVRSNTISVKVEKTPVEAIVFTCENTFKLTEHLQLSAIVYPTNATNKDVTFEIVSSKDANARIEDGCLFAEREGEVIIRATADGVSREMTVKVMKEPAANIIFNSAKKVKVYEDLCLTATVYPFNATYKDVTYELLDNAIGAKIFDGNVLYCETVGSVVLRIRADGIYIDQIIEITKEPVVNIALTCPSTFKHTQSLALSASVMPRNATYDTISYEIVSGEDFAWIEDGILYASRPGVVTICFTADGFSKEYDIKVSKEAVTDVTLDGTDEIRLNKAFRLGDIELRSNVYPSNATYSDVEYAIVSKGDNCDAYIEDGRLIVELTSLAKDNNGFAQNLQATVTVSATADGITTLRNYSVTKEKVSEIALTKKLQEGDGPVEEFAGMTFRTSGAMYITVNILSEIATCRDYKISINNKEVERTADDTYKLSSESVGKISVQITSMCDASMQKMNYEFDVEVEEVDAVYLGSEVQSGKDDDKIVKIKRGDIPVSKNAGVDEIKEHIDYSYLEVQQSSSILLRAFAHAENLSLKATYGDKDYLTLYYVVDGVSKKVEMDVDNGYFKYNGQELTISANAPVNKSFYIYAKEEKHSNIESERTEIKIQSQYILDINSTEIDNNGLVNGLSGLNGLGIVEKVAVKITHTSGIVIEKTVNTQDPSLRLQLFNPNLGGSFALEYTVYFNENGNRYNYVLPKVKSFAGLNTQPANQSPETSYNAIVFFDIASKMLFENYNFGKNIKVIYIRGNHGMIVGAVDIDNDIKNRIDMYIDNANIFSNDKGNGINIKNNGDFCLTTFGEVSIKGKNGGRGSDGTGYDVNAEVKDSPRYGGRGSDGEAGGAGIATPGNLEIVVNGKLNLTGGDGGLGGRGGDGEGSNQKDIGRAGDGGSGGDGGKGGDGIVVEGKLVLKGDKIIIQSGFGGAGGNGGNGGKDSGEATTADDGGDGGHGGRGGHGGDGIYARYIDNSCASLEINTGYGGEGGDGGNGGKTRYVFLFGKAAVRGAGGSGGNGGNSGNGLLSYSDVTFTCYIGDGGVGGKRGVDGGANADSVKVRPNNNTAGVEGSLGQQKIRL